MEIYIFPELALKLIILLNVADDYDWKRCLRFGLYGALFTAPTLYGWIRLTSRFWKESPIRKVTIKNAIQKSMVEQFTYGPSAMACFFFAMELMETHSLDKARHEVKVKFWPTYQTAICFWPIFQTLNFSFIKEKNRVVAVSMASFMWTIFLSYMKQMDEERAKEKQLIKRKKSTES